MFSDQEFWGLYVPCTFATGHWDLPVNKTVELGNTSFGEGFGLPWIAPTRYSSLTHALFEKLRYVKTATHSFDVRENNCYMPTSHWYSICNKEYLAIDINGHDRALAHDLQKEITDECKLNYFEILLDFGTIEHVKSQYNAWKNCHNLVKMGGVMLHSLPCHKEGSWVDHCYHWYTLEFFQKLAEKCDYAIRLLDEVKVLQSPSDYQVWVCFQKNSDNEFISEDEFIEIMEEHVHSEYHEKSNGETRHGVPKQVDYTKLGDI
ncbi:MAG TPA: hypothetical protein EYG21_05750 [Nitrospinaceae bacterium]|jgi:hypothetical protein|nr:hypothetical protein [Nitrospinaceae bacterium]